MLVYRRKIFSVMDRNLNNIQEYTEEDLKNPEIVQFLCNDYYFYDVHITKSGWDFLISHYGYDGLYAIDKSCQFGFCRCHDDSSPEAYRKWIQERIAEYPHVPDNVYPADTPEGIARSALKVGKSAEEVAELFELPPEYVQNLDKEIKDEKRQNRKK